MCESNPLCRRLTLKDYLPSVMTRFTKYRMLFEAMQKFVSEDPVEAEKLARCIECADYILKRMNTARQKKEQEALLRQIKSNLDIQIPNDQKLQNLQVGRPASLSAPRVFLRRNAWTSPTIDCCTQAR